MEEVLSKNKLGNETEELKNLLDNADQRNKEQEQVLTFFSLYFIH